MYLLRGHWFCHTVALQIALTRHWWYTDVLSHKKEIFKYNLKRQSYEIYMPKLISISIRPLLHIAAWISLQCKVKLVRHNVMYLWLRVEEEFPISDCICLFDIRSWEMALDADVSALSTGWLWYWMLWPFRIMLTRASNKCGTIFLSVLL